MRVRLVCAVLCWGCAEDKDGVETADSGVDCSDPDADHYDGVPVTVGLGVGPVCGTAVVSNVVTGEVAGEQSGSAVAGADSNGDGLSDLLVQAESLYGYSDIYVMQSPFAETSTIAAGAAVVHGVYGMTLSGVPEGLGDQDGDGYEDLTVVTIVEQISGPIFFGPVFGERDVVVPDAWIAGGNGTACNAGDLDGDGTGDIVYTGLEQEDVVYNYLLYEPWVGGAEIAPDTPAVIEEHDDENCGFERVWDVGGDGLDDVLLQCSNNGRAYMVESPVEGIVSTADADAALSRDGHDIMARGAGDTNGDGVADILVGELADWQNQENPYGEVYLLTAPFAAELSLEDAETSWYGFYDSFEHFADDLTIAASGADINADGFADFWLHSYCPPAGWYRTCQHLVLSPATGRQSVSETSWGLASAAEGYSRFGSDIVGDTNGDGLPDTAFGEFNDFPDYVDSGLGTAGGVWVLPGGGF